MDPIIPPVTDGIAEGDPRSTYFEAARKDPDQLAQIFQLSDGLEADPAYIEQDLDFAKRIANQPDWQALKKQNPILYDQMTNPKFAGVAQDDMKNLMHFNTMANLSGTEYSWWDRVKSSFKSGVGNVKRGKALISQDREEVGLDVLYAASDEQMAKYNEHIRNEAKRGVDTDEAIQSGLQLLYELQVQDTFAEADDPSLQFPEDMPRGDTSSKDFLSSGYFRELGRSTTEGFAGSLPAMGVGIATGPVGGYLSTAQDVAGSKYAELLEKNVDPDVARRAALVAGFGSAPFEYLENIVTSIPLFRVMGVTGKILKQPAKELSRQTLGKLIKQGGKDALIAAGVGGMTEWAQSIPDLYADIIAHNPDITTEEAFAVLIANAPEKLISREALDTFIIGALTEGGMAATFSGGAAPLHAYKAHRAEQTLQRYKDLQESVSATNLVQRDKELFADYAGKVLEKNGEANVYLQGESLVRAIKENGMTVEEWAKKLNLDEETVLQSAVNGEDVEIPSGQVAAALNDDPVIQSMLDEIKVSPEDISVAGIEYDKANAEASDVRLRELYLNEQTKKLHPDQVINLEQQIYNSAKAKGIKGYTKEYSTSLASLYLSAGEAWVEEVRKVNPNVTIDDFMNRYKLSATPSQQVTKQDDGTWSVSFAGLTDNVEADTPAMAVTAAANNRIAMANQRVASLNQNLAKETDPVARQKLEREIKSINDQIGQYNTLINAASQEGLYNQDGVVDESSQPFVNWTGNGGKVIQPEDINDTEIKAGTTYVFLMNHGTTHTIEEFDAMRGNPEGFVGRTNYFTSSEYDAEVNYAGKGPDLSRRIEDRTEQIVGSLESEYSYDFNDDFDAFITYANQTYGDEFFPLGLKEDQLNDAINSYADSLANKELYGGKDQIMGLYVRTDNAFVLEDGVGTISVVDHDEFMERAKEMADDPNDEEELMDIFYDLIDSEESELFQVIREVASKNNADPKSVLNDLRTLGEVSNREFWNTVTTGFMDETDDSGRIISHDIAQQIVEAMGYDSIILKDADQQFETMDMEAGTTHVHIFHKNRSNIKSINNIGTFDINDPNIYHQEMSTRMPTPSFNVNSIDNLLSLNSEALFENEKALEKNVEVMLRSPAFRDFKGTPKQKADKIIKHMMDNLLFLYDQVDPEIRERSKLWYDGANKITKEWADRYGMTPMQTAASVAVLSPQKDWFTNVSLAERVIDVVLGQQAAKFDTEMAAKFKSHASYGKQTQRGDNMFMPEYLDAVMGKSLGDILATGNYEHAAIFVRMFDQVYNNKAYAVITPEGGVGDVIKTGKGEDKAAAWGSFGEIAKAISVVFDGSHDNVHYQLGENHKVRSFYNNIFVPNSEEGHATMDTHAMGAAQFMPFSAKSYQVSYGFGGKSKGDPESGSAAAGDVGLLGTYPLYHEAYKRAAEAVGILPRQMQSITWEAIRGLFGAEQKSKANAKKVDEIWKRYQSKKISKAKAREEVIELFGGIKQPDWVGTEANTEIKPTYNGRSQRDVGKMPPVEVQFEVAPNPANKGATADWNTLPIDIQRQITTDVAAAVIPDVLAAFNTTGTYSIQAGGYEGGTTPNIVLNLDDPANATRIAQMLGYALDQAGMIVASTKQTGNLLDNGAVTIDLPVGTSLEKISEVYSSLYEIEVDGEKIASGHTTINDQMVIFNFTDIPLEEFSKKISEKLGSGFMVNEEVFYSNLIEDYNYDPLPEFEYEKDGTVKLTKTGSPKSRTKKRTEPIDRKVDQVARKANKLYEQQMKSYFPKSTVSSRTMPAEVSIGLGSFKPTPIYNGTLYRETNLDGLTDILKETLSNTPEQGWVTKKYFSDTPDLALGQHGNKGVMMEFDGENIHGTMPDSLANRMPASGKEYVSEYIGRDSLISFILPKGSRLKGSSRVFASRHFDKETLEDGTTKYTRKGPESQRLVDGANFPAQPEHFVNGLATRNGFVRVVHWSKVEDLETISPSAYGTGKKGAEAKRKESPHWVDRSYYGLVDQEAYEKEYGVGQHPNYIDLRAKDIYDIGKDPDGLKAKSVDWNVLDQSLLEKNIKKAGYKGYWALDPQLGGVIAYFDEVNTTSTTMEQHAPTEENLTEEERAERTTESVRAVPAERTYQQQERASISFQSVAEGVAGNISLTEKADLSSVVHEMGHFFLEMVKDTYETMGGYSEEWATIKKEYGIEGDIKRSQHEAFARDFEQYLGTGKAPSLEMQSSFEKFKKFIVNVYGTLKRLGRPLSPEMTSVFDKLLATQNQIKEVKEYDGLFTILDNADLSETDAKLLAEASELSDEEASRAIDLYKMMDLKERRKEYREQAGKEWSEQASTRAIRSAMDSGGIAISEKDTYGDGFPKNVGLFRNEGRPLAAIAIELDMSTSELVTVLKNHTTKTNYVETRVVELEAEHDAQLDPREAVHSAKLRKQMEVESKLLAKLSHKQRVLENRRIKAYAEKVVKEMNQREINNVAKTIAALRRARLEANKHVKDGNFDKALEANERARLNEQIVLEKIRARKKIDSIQRSFKHTARAINRNPKDYRDEHRNQISRLFARFQLGRILPQQDDTSLAQFFDWLNRDINPDDPIDMLTGGYGTYEWLYEERDPKQFNTMSYEEISNLDQLIKFLKKDGRFNSKDFLSDGETKVQDRVNLLINKVSRKLKPIGQFDMFKRIKAQGRKHKAEHIPIQFLMMRMDGYDLSMTGDNMQIFNSLAEAHSQKHILSSELRTMLEGPLKQLRDSAMKHPRILTNLKKPPKFEGQENSDQIYEWTFDRVIAVALNMGNIDNLQKLADGYGWTIADLYEITNILTQEDLNAVQSILDAVNTLKPKIGEIHKKLKGYEPTWIEANEITFPAVQAQTINGVSIQARGEVTLKGGYYPIYFDNKMSSPMGPISEKDMAMQRAGGLSGSTKPPANFTLERQTKAGGRAISLSLNVLMDHLSYATHYVTHAVPLSDAMKVVGHKDYFDAVKNSFGVDMAHNIRKMMAHIADPSAGKPLLSGDQFLEGERHRATAWILWFNDTVALKQPYSILNFISTMGKKDAAKHLIPEIFNMMTNPLKFYKQVHDLSPNMASRAKAVDRDLQSADKFGRIRKPTKGESINTYLSKISDAAGPILIRVMDTVTAYPAWMSAYKKGMEDFGGDVGKARQYADALISATQPFDRPLDQPIIRASKSGMNRFFTMFSGFLIKHANLKMFRTESVAEYFRTGGKSGDHPIEFLSHVLLERVAPAMLMTLMIGWWRDEEEELETNDYIFSVLSYQFAGRYLVQDAANLIAAGATGQWQRQVGDVPVVTGIKLVGETGKMAYEKITSGQFDENLALSFLQLLEYATRLPLSKAYKRFEEHTEE